MYSSLKFSQFRKHNGNNLRWTKESISSFLVSDALLESLF